MFNLARYNQQPFNHTAQTSDIIVNVNIITTMGAMVANGENIHEEAFIYANAGGSVQGASAEQFTATIPVTAGMDVVGGVTVLLEETISVVCSANVSIGDDVQIVETIASVLSKAIEVGENIIFATTIPTSLMAAAEIGEDIYQSILLTSILDGQITTEIFNVKYTTLNIVIPPGSTLIVDSDNFLVLLDGEDVISCHSGEWIFLNRDVADIIVQNPLEANLQTKVMYTEKYL